MGQPVGVVGAGPAVAMSLVAHSESARLYLVVRRETAKKESS
jgi:hypothetical protein